MTARQNSEAGPVGAESGFENVTAPLMLVTGFGYSEKRTPCKRKAGTAEKAVPATRNAAIAAKCRDCIFDQEAAGTWRQQVTVCPSTDCALWTFRPLAEGIAPCFKARSPNALPDGWQRLPQAWAIGSLEPSKQGIGDISNGKRVSDCQPGNDAQQMAPTAARQRGAG